MRFDSAFLTKAKNVGIQVVDGKETFTVYRNQFGGVCPSESATKEQKQKMLDIFSRKEKLYAKKSYAFSTEWSEAILCEKEKNGN